MVSASTGDVGKYLHVGAAEVLEEPLVHETARRIRRQVRSVEGVDQSEFLFQSRFLSRVRQTRTGITMQVQGQRGGTDQEKKRTDPLCRMHALLQIVQRFDRALQRV